MIATLPQKQRIALVNGRSDPGTLKRAGRARICYLDFSALLKPHGHTMLYVDARLEGLSDKEILGRLRAFQPDVVAFSCFSEGRFELINLMRQARQMLPNTCFVVGGHQFTYYSEDALERAPEIDIIFRGEADETFPKVVANRFDPDSLGETPGLTFRRASGEIVATPDALPPDISNMPIPDWSIVPAKAIGEYAVISSRGCVGNCNFCATGKRKLRFRDPESVLEEIALMLKLFGHRQMDYRFDFYDDSLTLSRPHLHALMNGMIERQFNLHWVTRARANTMTPENVKLLKAAGCVSVSLPFDAPNQKILDVCGKREKMEDIFQGIEEATRAGIKVDAAILVGNVTETLEDSQEGFELYRKLLKMPNVKPAISTLMLFPQTELEHVARENGSLPQDFSWYNTADMERVPYRSHGSLIPSFANGIVPFGRLEAMIDEVSILSSRGYVKQMLKPRNWGQFLRPATYGRIAGVLSSVSGLWLRRLTGKVS